MGVRRAVEMAWREGADPNAPLPGRQVFTLGPLIHNPLVLKSLKERRVNVLEPDGIPAADKSSTVIIRAHGVPPNEETALRQQGVCILDATCPHVKESQVKAYDFAKKGYRIFLAGEENHAEISGILGYASAAPALSSKISSCFVVANPQEAEKAALELSRTEPNAKTVLIGQTTISTGEYRAIGERLRQFFPNLEIVDTICSATADRQKALARLCDQVDAVIIAGGRESANTRRLLTLARELGKPAWITETPEDLPFEIRTYETVGLSAGASTPDSLISEIEKALSKQ